MSKNVWGNMIEDLEIFEKMQNLTPGWLANYLSNNKWKYTDHLKLIDEALAALSNRRIKKLIINMPPRHGKSELVSKYFPVWYLMKNPGHRIILTSYGADFAASWGKKVKDIIDDNEEYLKIKIDPSSNSAKRFDLLGTAGGMATAGAGGQITGKGAHLLIIDDPVKNDSEANSIQIREKVWEWFNATAYTRLEPDGAVVLIMTRWHEDDLCGRLLKNNAHIKIDVKSIHDFYNRNNPNKNKWHLLRLPAIAGEDDPLGRMPGEALWSRRYPIDKLNEIKEAIGSYWFSGLYQQSPAPAGGGIFKRKYFRYFREEDEYYRLSNPLNTSEEKVYRKADCKVFSVMDLAVTVSQTSDYTVIIIFALTPNNEILIFDVIRERFEGADHLNLLKSVYERCKPLLIGIESVQYQLSLVQSAQRLGFPVKPLKADKDKISRALPLAARIEAGAVYFLNNASWLTCFEEELLYFPKGMHDDQVDALAYSIILVQPVTSITPAGRKIEKISADSITKGF